MSNHWIEDCITGLTGLKGRRIKKVLIAEMAFIEDKNGKPVFDHPSCPFLQANVLDFYFYKSRPVRILVNQTDNWSMCSAPIDYQHRLESKKEDIHSIFRTREIINFPKGQITSVSISQGEDMDIEEIRLVVEDQVVLLKLGEVYENNDISINVVFNDESILVFLESGDLNRVKFSDSYYKRSHRSL